MSYAEAKEYRAAWKLCRDEYAELEAAAIDLLRVLDRFDNAPVSASDAIETLRARVAFDEGDR